MSIVLPSFRDHMRVIKTKDHARFYVTEEELRIDFINAIADLLRKYGVTLVRLEFIEGGGDLEGEGLED